MADGAVDELPDNVGVSGVVSVAELVAASEVIDGRLLLVCDNAAIAGDGTIWFSDSSARFRLEHWKGDLIEHSGTGRLLRRDPSGRVEVRLTGLHLPTASRWRRTSPLWWWPKPAPTG